MKRRNADCGKIRRPIKRNKIAEGMYGSTTILYMKFLILWAIVITADFMFMFRFEFLWPFWLLLRSVHDSFKYKGLAFSVLFVCIAITSDLVCLFFIPVHWLLFAASTYVWVQYVWHTDKGICLPTIILWMLFVYLEAGIRWKDSRHMPHLDLCRPFAAHCIGYPVVTLGFGFKSYVGYRMRQRKQREVAKENEFYMQLLQQALPQDETLDDMQSLSAGASVVVSTASSATVSSAQTVQTNSVTFDHSSHGDEKNHIPLIGNLISSQNTQTSAAAIQSNNNHHQQHHHHHNLNNSNSGSSNRNAQTNSKLNNISNSTTATANGHVPNTLNGLTSNSTTSKSQRRSVDKEKNDSSQTNSLTSSSSNSNNNRSTSNNVTTNSSGGDSFTASNNLNGSSKLSNNAYLNQLPNHLQKDAKDKDNWDSCASSTSSSSSSNNSMNSTKEGKQQYSNSYEMTNGNHSLIVEKKNQPNGNLVHYDVEEVVAEPIEKVKGRRNRSKKEPAISSKDNHSNYNGLASQQHHHHHLNNNSSNHHNHHNNHQQQSHLHKDSTTSLDSTSTSSSSLSSTTSSTISNVASQIVTKICETCLRLEAEIKKYRTEISHMKQIENELRQKMESNAVNKSCLQAKQRENDEMEKRLQELSNARQVDLMNLQNAERRLGEERRQRQSLDSLLNNEKKARKIAEEKATRPECSEQCKQRKLQIEAEIKQLRRELKANEDSKLLAEQQGRKFEQELRMFEQEVRNREAQQGTEVLMSALAAMQDKNSTLEKNLSAETRVKLDLFSALGEAKRQLEIKDSMIRNKDDEVLDLKAKIAQLLAVMPTDSLCLPKCSTTGSSMLRMNDTPPLQGQSSPMMSLNGPTHQQMMQHQQQLNSRNGVVGSNIVTVVTSASGVTNVVTTSGNCIGNNSLTQTSSNLDPNATAYTPKNSSLVGGAEA